MDSVSNAPAIRELFSRNKFMAMCGIAIDEIHEGSATCHMDIDGGVHVNPAGFVHGGAFSTLANTATGVACCSLRAMTVTLNITVDFMANTTAGHRAIAVSKVEHHGRRTLVVNTEIRDELGTPLAFAVASMYVKGTMNQE